LVRKLHIGGATASPGWEVLNIAEAPFVDHVGNANNLSRFEVNTFECIYASHIFEHFDYKGELQTALHEWLRVLRPGGNLYISVPDLDTISGLMLDKDLLDIGEQIFAMRMLFGGHEDPHDYHLVGFNEDILRWFLEEAGFTAITRVKKLGFFRDTSTQRFKGKLISLNVTAVKPLAP
jgi:predicted SAM-dependent methyltransferase